jgi:hypothetical protein
MARHGRSYLNVGIGVYPAAGGAAAGGVTYNDSCTGTITLSGSRVEGKVGADARSGQITLTGTRAESQSRSESRSGTVFLTGTRVEVFSGTYRDSPTGTVFLNGTVVESSGATVNTDSPIGIIRLSREETAACEALYPSLGTFPSLATYPVEPCGPGADPVLSWLRVREKPSLNQSVMVTTSSGKTYRWGEDDPVPEKSFHSLVYGSGQPGGFDQMTATLPRKAGVDYPDLELFENVQVINAGGEVTGEYRLDSAPVTAGNDFVITPNATGYQAVLEDRKDCTEIFVDIDYSHWEGPSVAWRIANSSLSITDPAVQQDNAGTPSVWTGTNQAGTATMPHSSAVYNAGRMTDIGSVYYGWTKHTSVDVGDAAIAWRVELDSNDNFPSPDSTGELRAAGPGSGTLASVASGNQYARLVFEYENPLATTWSVDHGIWWQPAVYGEHGLTGIGSNPQGFRASGVIEYVIETFTDLNVGTIDVTSFKIPHLEFRNATTPAEMIKQANRFHLFDWFIGPGQTFHYRERGTYGRSWIARVGPAKLEATGQATERCVTDVLVSFQDPDGTPKYVGPVGSGADTESATLHDSDTQNPANVAGIARWAVLDMGGVSTGAAATQVGERFLEEANALDHSGRAELTGHVMNDAGVLFPFSSVQAGDTITFIDAADTSPRRIVKATKGSNSVSIDLDAPPEGTQALLERLGVQWTNLSAMGAPTISNLPPISEVLAGQHPITQEISETYNIKP